MFVWDVTGHAVPQPEHRAAAGFAWICVVIAVGVDNTCPEPQRDQMEGDGSACAVPPFCITVVASAQAERTFRH